jgi:hypothetical protein
MRFLLISALITGSLSAQQAAIPRMPDGHPDFQGVWQHPYVPDVSLDRPDQKGAGPLPFNEAGSTNFKNYDPAKYDYTGHCLPFGLVRGINAPYPIQIMQNKKYLAFLFEQSTWFHIVYIDGRDHPTDVEPTWFGHSVGKWEGDTLVIDTIGFNGKTRLDTIGHPASDKLHVVEKMEMTDPQHINYEITMEDPTYYSKPFKNTRVFTMMKPGQELIEYSCEENNRDFTEGHIK